MGTENVDRPAVADAGPLIHLHEGDALDQLGLFETLLVRTLEALRDQSTLFVRPALVNRVIAKLKNG